LFPPAKNTEIFKIITNRKILIEMKTNFWLGALFGAGVLLSLWDARFWFPVVLIVLLAL
jgi:hypothetical protein